MKTLIGSTRKTVAGLAAGALVAGGSLILATAPANAATMKSADLTYNCITSVGPSAFTVEASTTMPSSVMAGQTVRPKNTTMDLTIPADLVGLLHSLTVTKVSGSSAGAAFLTNSKSMPKVPIKNLSAPATALPASGPLTLHATGTPAPFKVTKAGTLELTMPKSFIFDALASPLPSMPFPCTLAPGQNATIGSLKVTKDLRHASKVTAKVAPKKVTHKTHAKVAVKVTTGSKAAKGKVKVTEGKTTLAKAVTLKNGKKTLTLKLLKKGTHKVTVSYAGNSTTKASVKKLTIKVTK